MTTQDSFPSKTPDAVPFAIIEDLDSQETYPVIKPEFAAKFASSALKHMANINRIESAAKALIVL